MISLRVLTGRSAGSRQNVTRFPITAGRDQTCGLSLAESGVFARHFEIRFDAAGFTLSPAPEAPVTINGQPSGPCRLRNGDVIGAGYAKIQFWLGETPQEGLLAREIFGWLMVAGVIVVQALALAALLRMAS